MGALYSLCFITVFPEERCYSVLMGQDWSTGVLLWMHWHKKTTEEPGELQAVLQL